MDAVTRAVREMYTAFPYPAGAPVLRQGTDARLLSSYARRARPVGRPLSVLDAGCGRGAGLVGSAASQPDVAFTGIDVCARSLADARAEVERRKLANVRLDEVDLMTLEGCDVPYGGFDVVLSSGVVHHLSDPVRGLAGLARVLAPHGVLSLMVYGTRGREPLYRLVRAIDALVPRSAPLEERVAVGRALVAASDAAPLRAGPWGDLATIGDVEFVDRYLNVHETSYDVPGLLGLAEAAGLAFLRWTEPADWDVEAVLAAGPARERARALPERARWSLVDELTWRPSLEALFVRPDNGPREPLTDRIAANESLALSPDATLRIERRNLRGAQRIESITAQVRRRAPLALQGPAAQVALLLEHQQATFRFRDLATAAGERGLDPRATARAVLDLLRAEVLYRPHAADA